jgi:fatty acid desaturase
VAAIRPLFRYTAYDAFPAACGIAIVALMIWTFVAFESLSWWVLAPAFFALAWSYTWNMNCISHNFIHNPFFTNIWLNRAYSVLETLAIGVPHVFYHHYHMNHHFGDSDAKGPDGSTRDWSSIYRYGKGNQPEGFWSYCFLSFFRAEVRAVVEMTARHGWKRMAEAAFETAVLAAFWITMAVVSWRYFVFFYLPCYYLGWVLTYAESYLEHYGCKPGDPFANSVSTYNRLYNVLWFNNGYHQEHHWSPKWHWTRMYELHEQLRPQLQRHQTRTLRGPHITALIEDAVTRRRKTKSKTEREETRAPLAA